MNKKILIARYIRDNNTFYDYYADISFHGDAAYDEWTFLIASALGFEHYKEAEQRILSFIPNDGYIYKIEVCYY